ncbi:hypothetical protein J2809_000112 [Arthrobacter pascens]|nr:hypothetical protein [Arthrobacter pascens]
MPERSLRAPHGGPLAGGRPASVVYAGDVYTIVAYGKVGHREMIPPKRCRNMRAAS